MSTIGFPEIPVLTNPYPLDGNKSNPKTKIEEVKISSQIASIFKSVGFSFADIMGNDGEKICSLVYAIFDKTSELTKKTEERIRELLQDHHNTFSLFTKGMDVAIERASLGEKVSVDLYIQDIGNDNFLETLERAKENGLNPSSFILEIRSEDYGVMDSSALDNLRKASHLGFSFSINDFVLRNNEIKADNLEKIIQANLFPSYIRIAKRIYEKMKSGTLKLGKSLQDLFKVIHKRGINILVNQNEKEENMDNLEEKTKVDIPLFLKESQVEKEGIYDIDGKLQAEEGLIRFGDNMSVPQGLEKLKELGMTGYLFRKMLIDSVSDVLKGKKRSLNVYIKNLGSKTFHEEMENVMRYLPLGKRKGLVFEILEERYGAINYQVLENIKFLQEQGFAIAIDDLFLGNNPKGMSKEILEILVEEGIHPDYIKIDGRHIEAIRKGELPEKEIAHLREIIGYFSLLQEKPIFILEWIQDTEHALQVLDLIGMPGATFWYQGRNIQEGNFGLSVKEEKVVEIA